MVKELLDSKIPIETLLIQEDKALDFSFPAQEKILISNEVLKKITGVPEPEPVAAVISIPSFQNLSHVKRLLVLDGISDPGNLGTLLRTSLALGWDGVYLLENTCDPFNEKALRSAKGATFRIPLSEGSWEDFTQMIKDHKFQVIVADTEGTPLESSAPTLPFALIMSRESQGPREEAQQFQKVTIPMEDSMESLNVASAGAILLYTLRGKNE